MRGWAATTIGIVLAIAACTSVGAVMGYDPMLPMEVVTAAILATWVSVLAHHLWAGSRLGRELGEMSRPMLIAGAPCSVVEGGGALACVVGALRPRTFIGAELLVRLAPDELEAVVLHEDFHRRTMAPLRAAALHAWVSLVGRSTWFREPLAAREADLERQADHYAMQQGVKPASIARALLKTDPSALGMAFADNGEARIRALASDDHNAPRHRGGGPMPYEWLPIALVTVIWLGCHMPLWPPP